MSSFQQPAAPSTTATVGTPEARNQEFKPVGAGREMTSGPSLLVAAYAAIWVIIFALLFRWRKRQRGVEARLAKLETALAKSAAEADAAGSIGRSAPRDVADASE